MTDHHNDHDQNDQENHDDCQDCKRQRAENDKLIEIYQKLQQVDQRTLNMKQSVVVHKDSVQKSLEIIKRMDQKVDKIKNNKQEQNKSHFQQLGFTLFAEMIEKQKKSQVQKENQRLKHIIKNLRDQRSKVRQQTYEKLVQKKSTLKQTSILYPQLEKSQQKTAAQWFSKGPVTTSRSESRKSSTFRDTEMEKSFEIFSTKSTFNMTKRKTFQKKDFQELNLWLFEQRNQILEKQLYDKSIQQKVNDQTLKRSSIFKQSRSQRYSQKAKNARRLDESIILDSTHLRRPNHLIKKDQKQLNNERNLNKSLMKNSYNIETIKSVLPPFYQPNSSNKFMTKRAKINTIFPSINNK